MSSTIEQQSGTAGHTDNSVYIDADIDHVWRMTNDLPTWPDLFTEYSEVEILALTDTWFRFRLKMRPDETGRVWSWVSERTMYPDEYRTKSHRIETGPFEYMNIEWYFEEEGEGTRMRWVQDFRMRPDAPVDTPAMVERINANTAVQMDVIRRKLEHLAA